MILSEKTLKATEAFITAKPQKVQHVIMNAFKDLMSSSLGEQALNRGDKAIDFILTNARGGETSLAELTRQGPLVLSFYRGGWCPFCNLEFKALHTILPKIKALGAQLVGISPELPGHSMSTIERHQLQFEVLSDIGNQVAWQYGLVMQVHPDLHPYYLQWGYNLPELNGDNSFVLPIPATYVIDSKGTIRAAYINKDYTQRMEPDAIIHALKSITNPQGKE